MIQAQLFTNPVFYNKKVQELNSKLSELGWIEVIQPIARIGEDEKGTFPEVYYNDGSRKNIRIMPEGNSWSFFMLNGDIIQTNNDEGIWYTVPLSLYVWADLTKVYPAKNYDYTDELIRDVANVLEENACIDLVIITNNVFDQFNEYDLNKNQNMMLPYTGFKINFLCDLTMC